MGRRDRYDDALWKGAEWSRCVTGKSNQAAAFCGVTLMTATPVGVANAQRIAKPS